MNYFQCAWGLSYAAYKQKLRCQRNIQRYRNSARGARNCNRSRPGIGEEKMQVFNVFPNPSKGSFSVSGIETSEVLKLEVRNAQGKLVLEAKNLSKELNSFELNVENGICFATFVDALNRKSLVEKLGVVK